MVTERATTSVADIRRLANRLSGRDGPKLLAYADAVDAVAAACPNSTAAVLRAIRVQVGLGETMDVLDSSRREADRSTHTDDLVALEAVAALHPEAATFEAWLRELLARPAASGPACAALDDPQDQGPGVGTRHRLRRVRRGCSPTA